MDGITNTMHMSLGKLRESVMDREALRAVVHGIGKTDVEAETPILWPPDAKS